MTQNKSIVAVYSSHMAAEGAIKELQQSGFDMKNLSIVGRDYHTDEHGVGYCNAGDRMKMWGKTGASWGGLWGALFGSAGEAALTAGKYVLIANGSLHETTLARDLLNRATPEGNGTISARARE